MTPAAPEVRAEPVGRPLAIDLYCGLGGWTSGLQAAGWDVIGWDIEQHAYDGERYPGQLVVGDVRAIHGSQLKSAWLIVGSSPCTEYSYMAMPWTRAKAKAAAIRADETGEALRRLNELFDAQFRIQREAGEAAGRHIPMVVENVRGAIPWVGRSRANHGSYYLWGDVPALMPSIMSRKVPGFRFDGSGGSFQTAAVEAMKTNGAIPHIRDGHPHTKHLTNPAEHVKVPGLDWSRYGQLGYKAQSFNVVAAQRHRAEVAEARKGAGAGAGAGAEWFDQNLCKFSSKSDSRKAASAKIAKIPFTLAHWIGCTAWPEGYGEPNWTARASAHRGTEGEG